MCMDAGALPVPTGTSPMPTIHIFQAFDGQWSYAPAGSPLDHPDEFGTYLTAIAALNAVLCDPTIPDEAVVDCDDPE